MVQRAWSLPRRQPEITMNEEEDDEEQGREVVHPLEEFIEAIPVKH